MFDLQTIFITFAFFVLLAVAVGVLAVSLIDWITKGFRWYTLPGILVGLFAFSLCVAWTSSTPEGLEKEQKETGVQTVKEVNNEREG